MISKFGKVWGGFWALVVVTFPQQLPAQSLVVVTSDLHSAPYVMTDGVTFVGGVVKDINDEASKRTGIKVEYKILSRKSVDAVLEAGEGHAVCNIQPAWTNLGDKLVWTAPMLPDADLYWRKADNPDELSTFADLKNKSFATFQGYHHAKELMTQVEKGETKRVDLYAHQNIFDALLNGRVNYIVFSQVRGDYLLKDSKYSGKVVKTKLVDSSYQNFCAIHKKAPVKTDVYIAALNNMIKDGSLDKILAKYK